jgi:hypothetical protein
MKRKTLISVMAALILLVAISIGWGQALHPSIGAEEGKALSMIAKYAGSHSGWLDRQLESHRFQPGLPPDIWHPFPAVRKLEGFYLAAQAGGTGGGDKALALLARDLAQQYESVKYDPALKRYFGDRQAAGPLAFGKPASTAKLEWRASPEAGKAMLAIGKYCDGGTMGGAQGILQHYLDLPPETAFEILRTSNSSANAIQQAMNWVPEQERAPKIRTIVSTLQESYESARYEEAFVPFSDRHEWAPRERRPAVTEAARDGVNYNEYLESNHLKEAGARKFDSLKVDPETFGGVVLGNRVTPELPGKVEVITWLPDADNSSTGRLIAQFVDGTEKEYAPVLREDAYAAHQIVYAGVRGAGPIAEGEGVGLIGSFGEVPYFEIGATRIQHEGIRSRIVMHPAIADLDLGWSLMLADVLPRQHARFSSLLGSAENAAKLDATGWRPEMDGWKFTDVPLTISGQGGRLIVERQGGQFPEDLRRSAFFTLTAFSAYGGKARTTFPDVFYPLVPELTHTSHEYDRLNRFAAVLAIFRWAKASGAGSIGRFNVISKVPTPASIVLTEKEYLPMPDYEEAQARQALRAAVERKLREEYAALPESMRKQIRDCDSELQRLEGLYDEEKDPGKEAGLIKELMRVSSQRADLLGKAPRIRYWKKVLAEKT